MSNIPTPIPHYAFVVNDFNDHQLTAWLSLLTPQNLNLIIEVIHNILYNYNINLSAEQKKGLSKFLPIYKSLETKSVKRETKYIIARKNPKAIKSAFSIINDIYGSKL